MLEVIHLQTTKDDFRSCGTQDTLACATMPTLPPFITFPDYGTFRRVVEVSLMENELTELDNLHARGLPPISSINSLALLFAYSPRFLGAMIKRPSRYYRQFKIPKGRSSRTIDSPRITLKLIQWWVGQSFSSAVSLLPHVHGFVPKKSTITAASQHCGAKWIFSMDIEDFFPSIGSSRVVSTMNSLGYSRGASHLIADLVTLRGSLPQGSPASPVISNMVFAEADQKLKSLAEEYEVRLTRYADDITFSGESRFPEQLPSAVKGIIEGQDFRVSEKKTQLKESPQSLKVLGLNVAGPRPRLPKRYRNQVRMMRHVLASGNCRSDDLHRYYGHISYAKAVERLD